jgi:transcriptional repressor NrdR
VKCSQCQKTDTKVIESRDVADGQAIRRRRACLHCQYRFTTYERIERPQLIVIKNDGTREMFNRDKLMAGLYRACEKTPITTLQIEQLVDSVENDLHNCGETEIPTSKIGQLVMDKLAELDEVAYVRFASVYRRFTNIAGFEKELSEIRNLKTNRVK